MQRDPIQSYLAARHRMFFALGLLVMVVAVGAAGYWYLGNRMSNEMWTLSDCIYMTAITISTVGYEEVLDLDNVVGGRGWTLLLLTFGISANVYVMSAITSFFVESDFGNVRRIRRDQKRMENIKDHYIVCGVGGTGTQAVKELLAVGETVVAVDLRGELLGELRDRGVLPIEGDATDDDVMRRAGIERARGLVASLDDDKTNMFVVVSSRHTNPKLRIVAKAGNESASRKLRRVGADAVVTPTQIGGMRLASELIRPEVVRFLDEMRDNQSGLRIEEARVSDASSLIGKLLRDADLRNAAGVLILAVRDIDGEIAYVPPADHRLRGGQTLISIGTPTEIERLRRLVGHEASGFISIDKS